MVCLLSRHPPRAPRPLRPRARLLTARQAPSATPLPGGVPASRNHAMPVQGGRCDVGRGGREDGRARLSTTSRDRRRDRAVVAREDTGPILNGLPSQLPDIDPEETREWLESLDGAVDERGRTRARYLML